MANTTTVTGKVDIVDLIRDRQRFSLLQVPAMRITVTFDVTTTSLIGKPRPAPSARIQRMEDAARAELDRYEQTISAECVKFNRKIAALLQSGKTKDAQTLAAAVNASVRNALLSAQAAAEKAVEEARKKGAQADKLLTEARVKTAVKVAFAGISLAAGVTELVATSGAAVLSYLSVAKTLVSLALELKQQLQGGEALRRSLQDGVRAYLALRNTKVMQAARANGLSNPGTLPGFPQVVPYLAVQIVRTGRQLTQSKDAAQIAEELFAFTKKEIAAQYHDVEQARQAYRNHTAKMRRHIDSVSAQADKLAAAAKSAVTVGEGVKIGAGCMQVKAAVRKLGTALDQAVAFLAAIESVMQNLGLDCDDRTIVQKFQQLDKTTVVLAGSSLVADIYSVYSLVANLQAAVA